MGELNVMNVRIERIPLLWGTVRERLLDKGFSFNMSNTKHLCVCRKMELPGRGVHSEVRMIGRTMSDNRQAHLILSYELLQHMDAHNKLTNNKMYISVPMCVTTPYNFRLNQMKLC